MEVNESASRHSKRKKKDKKHRRSKSKSKSKSKKKHRKRSRRSSSSSEESHHHPNEKTSLPDLTELVAGSSHQEVVDLVRNTLNSLLAADPILNDLPSAVTLDEVQSLIALEHGQAIHIEIHREDGTSLPVIIRQNATTVGQLKRAVERATELRLSRDANQPHRRINWKYVWKTYWLYAHGAKLKDDMATIKDCAISNGDGVSFIKRLREK